EQLDGFDITHPATGLLDLRVSPDSLRVINVQASRYSAEYGKGSGGVLQLESGMGDDHFRFSATNFTPGISFSKGVSLENFTPRFTLSGPLMKGRAWWFEGVELEYDLNNAVGVPRSAGRSPFWRGDSLSRLQFNASNSNVLSAEFLVNRSKAEHVGISRFTPIASTLDQQSTDYMLGLKDSSYFSNHALLEVGVDATRFSTDSDPRGDVPYVVTPQGVTGNFFEQSHSHASRL